MGEAIVITSGKGGVGKTTTTANLSCALAAAGKSVVAVDADIGLRNLDIIMGLENRIVYNLVDVAKGRCKLRQALIRDKRNKNMYLLPASQIDDKTALNPEEMKVVVAELKKEFNYILIDCPAGIEQGFRNAIAAADRAIVVTTPEVSAVRDADRVIGLLQHNDIPSALVVTRLNLAMVESGEMMSQEDVMDILAIDLLGVVVEDSNVVVAGNQGIPAVLNEESKAGQAYLRIARRILGETVPIPPLHQKRGLLAKLFGK
ncbi:septum site-determining protein MinD [Deltaproteobacteria bacterium TL4]